MQINIDRILLIIFPNIIRIKEIHQKLRIWSLDSSKAVGFW